MHAYGAEELLVCDGLGAASDAKHNPSLSNPLEKQDECRRNALLGCMEQVSLCRAVRFGACFD